MFYVFIRYDLVEFKDGWMDVPAQDLAGEKCTYVSSYTVIIIVLYFIKFYYFQKYFKVYNIFFEVIGTPAIIINFNNVMWVFFDTKHSGWNKNINTSHFIETNGCNYLPSTFL